MTGCASPPSTKTLQDIALFSENVTALADLFETHIESLEAAHLAALKENTSLQFDLGGNPTLDAEPLFSYEAKSERLKLVKTLALYGQNLQSLYPAGQIPSGDIVGQFQKVEGHVLDFSHGVKNKDQLALIQSLNGTAEYLYSSYRDSQLGEVISKAHPLVEQAALLLYVDIGSPNDQSSNCGNEDEAHYLTARVGDFRLCRGGFRNMLKQAITARVTAIRQRLLLLKNAHPYTRQSTVDRLYDTQKSGRLLDQSMQKTQEVLFKLVAAHRELRHVYGGLQTEEADLMPAWSGASKKGTALSEMSDLLNLLPDLTNEVAALIEGRD
ncbi:MAG: hypothetical protein JJ879_12575 [Sneathiella sp.]|nr:hypothetical protein [Sneathiella sp.]